MNVNAVFYGLFDNFRLASTSKELKIENIH